MKRNKNTFDLLLDNTTTQRKLFNNLQSQQISHFHDSYICTNLKNLQIQLTKL